MTRTLLLILAAVALVLGTFLWFVLTWNPAERESLSWRVPPHLSPVSVSV